MASAAAALPFPLPFDGELVQRALRRLPPRQRQALLLRFGDGLCEREVAQVLGCRPSTAHRLIARGVSRARYQLRRDGALDVTMRAVPGSSPHTLAR